jgi:hypothetical protein
VIIRAAVTETDFESSRCCALVVLEWRSKDSEKLKRPPRVSIARVSMAEPFLA